MSRLLKGLLMSALGLVVLWWVAARSHPQQGTVIVHGLEADIEVDIAGLTHPFKDPTAGPLVLRLPAGSYDFRVRRGDTVLRAETFVLWGGESQVLAAIREDRGALSPRLPRIAAGEPSKRRDQGRPRGRSPEDPGPALDRDGAP